MALAPGDWKIVNKRLWPTRWRSSRSTSLRTTTYAAVVATSPTTAVTATVRTMRARSERARAAKADWTACVTVSVISSGTIGMGSPMISTSEMAGYMLALA